MRVDADSLGSYHDDNNGIDSGSAYIFRFNPVTSVWTEEAILLASDGAAYDNFGFTVSITGAPGNEVAIVAAHRDDDNGSSSGSVYIYRKSGTSWLQEDKLLASDGVSFDSFGFSVSLGDLDGDGDLDAFVGNLNRSNEIWINVRLPGDADDNREVAFADFLALSANFGKAVGAVWEDGDFDGNGAVDFADFLILSANFGNKRPMDQPSVSNG